MRYSLRMIFVHGCSDGFETWATLFWLVSNWQESFTCDSARCVFWWPVQNPVSRIDRDRSEQGPGTGRFHKSHMAGWPRLCAWVSIGHFVRLVGAPLATKLRERFIASLWEDSTPLCTFTLECGKRMSATAAQISFGFIWPFRISLSQVVFVSFAHERIKGH